MNGVIELDEGSVIGNYRVVRLLGQGGMGTVYEVEHLELGTHYALKTFTFDAENDASKARSRSISGSTRFSSTARISEGGRIELCKLNFESAICIGWMNVVLYPHD